MPFTTEKDIMIKNTLPPSYAQIHIPVRCSISNDLFLLSDGDLGVVYEISGIYDEILTQDELMASFSPILRFAKYCCSNLMFTTHDK